MAGQALLNINLDELFEKHSISEIKNVQSQIENEIEKKREELRTMVGEKCRDLLKAADTISEMKETTKDVTRVIIQLKKLCEGLQEKRLLGFKQTVNVVNTNLPNYSEELTKVVEIKILLSLPEQIWTAIDNNDCLLAAQLFLFATHLHLGLEVSSSAAMISKKYPVVHKQWETITSCKKIIIEGANKQLKIINISEQKTTDCLCSLIFLEVISYEKLLNEFFELRYLLLNDILQSEDLSRKKLRQIVETLQHTLVQVYECFFEKPEKKCLVQNQLDSITEGAGQPILSKIIQLSSLPDRYVSPLVLNFRPKTLTKLNPLSQDYIRKTLLNWMEKVEKLLQVELKKLLFLIEDLKKLHKILTEEIFNLVKPSNLEDILNVLLGENKLSVYDRFIKYHVTEHVKVLISTAWQNNINVILASLVKMEENMAVLSKKEPENDIRWFVWKENKVVTEKGLKLKTLGYTPKVMALCEQMNSFLNQLLEDINLYIQINSKSNFKTDDSDASIIFSFLNSCSFDMLKRLANEVKESYKEKEDSNNEANIIIRARFLNSLTTHCPGLENCLIDNDHNLEKNFKDKKGNIWQQSNVLLQQESFQMWNKWKNFMYLKLRNLIKSKLDCNISLRTLLKSKMLNEIITIEEETEEGAAIKSELRVPSQPSLHLQELLFQICQNLNAVIPHTIPRQTHQELVDSLVKDILVHYEKWSKSEIIYQSQAWQILLDVKFLTLMLISKENKDLSESICENLEKTIDPFDLDVYYPHLQNSVKKSTQKLQGSFGVLINFSEKLPVFNGLKLTQSSGETKIEEPNLLAVSSNIPWFPLLPVTHFDSRRADVPQFENQNSSSYKGSIVNKTNSRNKEKEKKESVTSDFFKSAGAFFDAMTGGWS